MAKHRGDAFWLQHVAAARCSGLSKAAYCRQHGLNRKTFFRWTRRDGAAEKMPSAVQSLVPLSVIGVPACDDTPLSLRVASDVVLTIPRSVDARWLGALLRAVAC